MDDMMDKIQNLLSDEESLKQIKELADMFMSSASEEQSSESRTGSEENGEEKTEKASGSESSSDGDGLGFDMGMIMKLIGLFGSIPQQDENTKLLLALRPLLKEEKQLKIDKAVRMMKLFAIWTVVKESGMLNDIF